MALRHAGFVLRRTDVVECMHLDLDITEPDAQRDGPQPGRHGRSRLSCQHVALRPVAQCPGQFPAGRQGLQDLDRLLGELFGRGVLPKNQCRRESQRRLWPSRSLFRRAAPAGAARTRPRTRPRAHASTPAATRPRARPSAATTCRCRPRHAGTLRPCRSRACSTASRSELSASSLSTKSIPGCPPDSDGNSDSGCGCGCGCGVVTGQHRGASRAGRVQSGEPADATWGSLPSHGTAAAGTVGPQ